LGGPVHLPHFRPYFFKKIGYLFEKLHANLGTNLTSKNALVGPFEYIYSKVDKEVKEVCPIQDEPQMRCGF
jgi:hypothetical protein